MAPDELTAESRSLIRSAATGDRDAFARLVADNDADMFRLSFLITGDPELARDAVQQAWADAWLHLGTLRDEGRLHSWLLSIAANRARGILRSRRAAARRERAFAAEATTPDVAPDDARIDLRARLAALSAEDRQLLALRYALGLDAKEIGSIIHVRHATVRSRLARLLHRLRQELDHE